MSAEYYHPKTKEKYEIPVGTTRAFRSESGVELKIRSDKDGFTELKTGVHFKKDDFIRLADGASLIGVGSHFFFLF